MIRYKGQLPKLECKKFMSVFYVALFLRTDRVEGRKTVLDLSCFEASFSTASKQALVQKDAELKQGTATLAVLLKF